MKLFLLIIIINFSGICFCQTLNWYVSEKSPISRFKNEDVYFVNKDVGFLTNNDTICKLFKTNDGGDNWGLVYSSKNFFRSLTFINEQTGWIGLLDNDLLIHTTNGGYVWEKVINIYGSKPSGICSLFKLNEKFLFGCGKYTGPAHFIKTTNGGIEWFSSNISEYATCLVDCHFENANTGFVIGGAGDSFYKDCYTVVLKTTNSGISWKEVYRNEEKQNIGWKIFKTDENFYQVSIQSFRETDTISFLVSLDSGNTWNKRIFKGESSRYESLGVCFLNADIGFVSGFRRSDNLENGETYITTDGGISWNANESLLNINRFRRFGKNLIFAIGKQFYRLNY